MEEIRTYQELQRFIEINKNVVVFIGSSKCGHCRNIHPEIVKLTQKYNHIKFVHIEVSKFDRMEKLNISQGVPVFDFYKYGQYNSRVEGADLDAIINKINSLYRNEQLQNPQQNRNLNYSYSQPNQMSYSQPNQMSYAQSNQMSYAQSNQMSYAQPNQMSYAQPNQMSYAQPSNQNNNYYKTPTPVNTPVGSILMGNGNLTNSQISMGYANQQNRNFTNNTFERFNTTNFQNNRN
jgi:thiol-disulfide isomerase/thioredoxin